MGDLSMTTISAAGSSRLRSACDWKNQEKNIFGDKRNRYLGVSSADKGENSTNTAAANRKRRLFSTSATRHHVTRGTTARAPAFRSDAKRLGAQLGNPLAFRQPFFFSRLLARPFSVLLICFFGRVCARLILIAPSTELCSVLRR